MQHVVHVMILPPEMYVCVEQAAYTAVADNVKIKPIKNLLKYLVITSAPYRIYGG